MRTILRIAGARVAPTGGRGPPRHDKLRRPRRPRGRLGAASVPQRRADPSQVRPTPAGLGLGAAVTRWSNRFKNAATSSASSGRDSRVSVHRPLGSAREQQLSQLSPPRRRGPHTRGTPRLGRWRFRARRRWHRTCARARGSRNPAVWPTNRPLSRPPLTRALREWVPQKGGLHGALSAREPRGEGKAPCAVAPRCRHKAFEPLRARI